VFQGVSDLGVGQIYGSDITERKQAEEALRDSEETFKAMLEAAQDAFIMIDDEGKVVHWNAAAEKMLGYEKEEILGKDLHLLLAPKHFHEAFHRGFKKFRVTGQGAAIGKTLKLAALKKGGTEFPVELSLASVRIKGKWNAIATLRDITERKQAEEALRESGENLRTYLENAPDGVYINDVKGTFLYGNKKAEEITGYKREELIGKSFLKLKLLPAKHLAKAGQLLALNAIGRATGPDELALIRKDGSHIWTEINTTPIKQQGKSVVIGFVRDITERKQAEEALRESEERYRSLIELGGQIGEAVIMLQDNDQGEGIQIFVSDEWPRITG
jgi:PAS domain S-box-containing protein